MPANIHATKRIKYETIFKCKECFSVRKMCKVLGVKESGMYPERVEKINPKTNSKGIDNTVYSENIVNRKFDIEDMNKVWAGDITYIKTQTGWTYLSIVMDLFNREIIGYSISKNIDTELVKGALGNAISRVNNTEGIIFHSDRGSQI